MATVIRVVRSLSDYLYDLASLQILFAIAKGESQSKLIKKQFVGWLSYMEKITIEEFIYLCVLRALKDLELRKYERKPIQTRSKTKFIFKTLSRPKKRNIQ